jgi:hypothetical protein
MKEESPDLSPFEKWMVKQNIDHATTEGITTVLARLRENGYHRVANAVEQATS